MHVIIHLKDFDITSFYKTMKTKLNLTIIVLVVLYWWCHNLKDEHKLQVFENKVHRKTFGPE
jgi:hypothetical protein